MVTRALFFDSVGGDRVYDSDDWELLFSAIVNDGTVPDIDDELLVEPDTPTDMSVVVNTGRAFVNGKLLEVSADEDLTIASNGSGSTRIDLVVARIDYSNRTGSIAVVQGVAGAGAPPNPQQDASRWELPLANVEVTSGAVDVKAVNITDRRVSAVSGMGVPSGVIMLWSGSTATIPPGWFLCNGSNGTPDLRGRFVVGAGGAYATGATGGAETVTLLTAHMPAHTHSDGTLSTASDNHSHTANSAGSHTHGIRGILEGDGNGSQAKYAPTSVGGSDSTGVASAGAHTHSTTSDSHSHDVTGATGSVGSGTAHENRPPYYALAYIQKA